MPVVVPDKGDFITIQFNPQAGHEQQGRRPGIVLSPKSFNQATGFAIVCPTTNQVKGYPFEVPIPSGYKVGGVVLVDQLKSLDWQARNVKVVDQAPQEVIDDCLQLISTFL